MNKVLVVENELKIHEVIGSALFKKGCKVELADTLSRAFFLAPTVDVVVLNSHYPDGNSEDFIKRMRDNGDYTPVIVLSLSALKDEMKEKLKNYGIVEVLDKPIDLKLLLTKVDEALLMSDKIKNLRESATRIHSFVKRHAP